MADGAEGFPPYQAVYEYFRTWRVTGVWERLHDTLRGDVRETAGRHREPSAGIILHAYPVDSGSHNM